MNKTKPSHYPINLIELAAQLGLDPFQTHALKYLCRAGKKSGESYQDDIQKAIEVLQQGLDFDRKKQSTLHIEVSETGQDNSAPIRNTAGTYTPEFPEGGYAGSNPSAKGQGLLASIRTAAITNPMKCTGQCFCSGECKDAKKLKEQEPFDPKAILKSYLRKLTPEEAGPFVESLGLTDYVSKIPGYSGFTVSTTRCTSSCPTPCQSCKDPNSPRISDAIQ